MVSNFGLFGVPLTNVIDMTPGCHDDPPDIPPTDRVQVHSNCQVEMIEITRTATGYLVSHMVGGGAREQVAFTRMTEARAFAQTWAGWLSEPGNTPLSVVRTDSPAASGTVAA